MPGRYEVHIQYPRFIFNIWSIKKSLKSLISASSYLWHFDFPARSGALLRAIINMFSTDILINSFQNVLFWNQKLSYILDHGSDLLNKDLPCPGIPTADVDQISTAILNPNPFLMLKPYPFSSPSSPLSTPPPSTPSTDTTCRFLYPTGHSHGTAQCDNLF